MNRELIGLAFAAGMIAAFNPCGFAMLPAYLALVIGDGGAGHRVALRRALAATAAMTAGFFGVFVAFGLLTVSVATAVQRRLPYVTVLIGVVLVGVGIWLLSGRDLPGGPIGKGARWAPTARLGSMFGYGVGYALASLSCTAGPFLAVTASSVRDGSPVSTVAVYTAYAAGIGLVVGVLAVAVAMAGDAVIDRMRRALRYVNRLGGALLIPVGLYVAYYGWFEIRLFGGTGSPDDPIIDAAGRTQRALAGWVYRAGGWPWLAALVLLAGTAAVVRMRRRRRTTPDNGARLDSAA